MITLEIERLYALYQSGATSDRADGWSHKAVTYAAKNADILQVAKAIGDDLTIEEFTTLCKEVRAIQASSKQRSRQVSEIWKLPDLVAQGRSTYRPKRDTENKPPLESLHKPEQPPVTISIDEPSETLDALAQANSGSQGTATEPSGEPDSFGMPLGSAESRTPTYTFANQPDDDGLRSVSMPRSAPVEPAANTGASGGSSRLDRFQTIADAVGIVDQTGITDLANGAVSVGRAIAEPDRAADHLTNAAISAVSAIPVVGDLAKLFKYGRAPAKAVSTGSHAAGHAASSTIPHRTPSVTIGTGQTPSGLPYSPIANSGSGSGAGSFFGSFFGGGSGRPPNEPPGPPPDSPSPGPPNGFPSGSQPFGSFMNSIYGMFAGLSGQQGPGQNRTGNGGQSQGFSGYNQFSGGESVLFPFWTSFNPDDDGTSRKTRNLQLHFEELAKKIPVVGEGIAAVSAGFRKLVDWINAVDSEGRRLIEANRQLAQYSGEISGAFMRYDAEGEMRKMERANYMDGSLADLAESQSSLETAIDDHLRPYSRAFANIQSGVSTIATIGSRVLAAVDPVRYILEKIFGAVDKNDPEKEHEFTQAQEALKLILEEAFRDRGIEPSPVEKDKEPMLPAASSQVPLVLPGQWLY